MTWQFDSTNTITGTIDVGCNASGIPDASNSTGKCDPVNGDTDCSTQLPVLCFKPGSKTPVPVNVNNSDIYHKWSGGTVATTTAVAGNSSLSPNLSTIALANAYCAQQFGPGWRVAEFHDGAGWHFQAYGGLGNQGSRVWAHINDQAKGTCWAP